MEYYEKVQLLSQINDLTRETAELLARNKLNTPALIFEQVRKFYEVMNALDDFGVDPRFISQVSSRLLDCRFESTPMPDKKSALEDINRLLVSFYKDKSKELDETLTGPNERRR